jgi:RNA polymerase sigma-32 factor
MRSTQDGPRQVGHHLFDEKRTRPLAPSQQQRLAAAYAETRDPRLERRLVEANLRLVVKIARDHDRSRGRDLDDLIQEGTLGLIQGIRRFDPSRGTRLSTYASLWIRAYVLKQLMDNVRVVRAVRTRADRAAFFHGTVATVDVSLDARRPRDTRPLSDLLSDPAPRIDELVETAELAQRVRQAADRLAGDLPERDAVILRERLLAEEPQSRQQVARRVSLSGERVRQIETSLCAAIQQRLGGRPGGGAVAVAA